MFSSNTNGVAAFGTTDRIPDDSFKRVSENPRLSFSQSSDYRASESRSGPGSLTERPGSNSDRGTGYFNWNQQAAASSSSSFGSPNLNRALSNAIVHGQVSLTIFLSRCFRLVFFTFFITSCLFCNSVDFSYFKAKPLSLTASQKVV